MKWILAVALITLPACVDPQTVRTAPEPGSPAPTASPSPTLTPEAGIGDAITLQGTEGGTQLKVEVLKVVDPAKPMEYFFPSKGHKIVAVQIRLTNVGTATYSDYVGNGAKLIDAESQQYEFAGGSVDHSLSDVTLPPGDERLGMLSFDVPEGTEPAFIQITLDSGFGPETGKWNLT